MKPGQRVMTRASTIGMCDRVLKKGETFCATAYYKPRGIMMVDCGMNRDGSYVFVGLRAKSLRGISRNIKRG